jgi:hypothetical protein
MNLMIIKRETEGPMETIGITTICEPAHIPREGETILYKRKEYTVLQVLWHYDENYVFIYCKEEN